MAKSKSPTHHCHAIGCRVATSPKMWSCKPHWYMVSKYIRDKIWAHYRDGQEVLKNPTTVYMYWFFRAQMAVAEKEGKTEHKDYEYAKVMCIKIKILHPEIQDDSVKT